MDLKKLKEAIGILNQCLEEYTKEESSEGEPLDRPTTKDDIKEIASKEYGDNEEEMEGDDSLENEPSEDLKKKKFGFKGAMTQKKTGMF